VLDSGTVPAGPVLSADVLYATGWDGKAYAVRASDGHELWQAPIGGGVAFLTPTPWVGALRPRRPGSDPPTVMDGAVFVTGEQTLYGLRASNGAVAWRYQTESPSHDTVPASG
jgi:outer membrane protein assembly factor BamB